MSWLGRCFGWQVYVGTQEVGGGEGFEVRRVRGEVLVWLGPFHAIVTPPAVVAAD